VNPTSGEVWTVDMGYAAKVRPCLVVSRQPGDNDRMLFTVIPMTTSCYGNEYEVEHHCHQLKGVFNVQAIVTVPKSDFIRRIANVNSEDYSLVISKLCIWLDLSN